MYNVLEFTVNINTHFTYYMKDKGSWYGIYDDISTADVWKKTLADALEIQHLKYQSKAWGWFLFDLRRIRGIHNWLKLAGFKI